MNVSRFCSIVGATDEMATHQRFTEYLRPRLEKYPGSGYTVHDEWVGEQTVQALKGLLDAVYDTDVFSGWWSSPYDAIAAFLDMAAEELTGDK